MDPVIRFLRKNRWARRGLSVLSAGLLVAAVGMLGYPVFTNFQSDRIQGRLTRELASPALEQSYRQGKLQEGDALTRIKIPSLNVDTVVVEGTGASALRAGAGHYPATPLPCETGNVAIAGHRTTYGKPFANLDRMSAGDIITLETPVGSCTYEMTGKPFIVGPRDLSVVADTPDEATLTLTTCHPKGSAAQRLIVKAKLVAGPSTGT